MPRPASTTERGYGWDHQQARAEAIRRMRDGTPCTRCHGPMYRSQAQHLDLDHTDDRRGYQGLAHRRCNRQAGQAKGVASRRAKRARKPSSAAVRVVNSRVW